MRFAYYFRLSILLPAAFIAAATPNCTPAQEPPEAPQPQATPQNPSPSTSPSVNERVQVSLSSALALAGKNSTVYQSAVTDAGSAHEDRTQARDALLPQLVYNNQVLYTQGTNQGGVRFIANN